MKRILLFLTLCFAFSTLFAATTNLTNHDPEIVAFMITLNKNEITAANLTEQKAVNQEVKNYADFLFKAHNKNLKMLEKLHKQQNILPLYSDKVISLQEKGQKEIKELTPLEDKAYDTAYIQAMINGHTDALNNIDVFLTDVENPQLKQYLEDTRHHVSEHLAKAKAIQQ